MNLLFLCTGNSCRSQMAEGWARQYGGDWLDIRSAGLEAHGKNPRAIAIMAEASVDISDQESTALTNEILAWADYVITVCDHADAHCPAPPAGARKEHWALTNPATATGREEEIMAVFRQSRDDIRQRVQALINRLRTEEGVNEKRKKEKRRKKGPE